MVAPEEKPYSTLESGVVRVWWQSKKFVAFMTGEATWKLLVAGGLAIVAVYNNGEMTPGWLTYFAFVIVTAGAAQMGYLGGQSWIDRYAKVIAVPARMGSAIVGGAVNAINKAKGSTPAPSALTGAVVETEDNEDPYGKLADADADGMEDENGHND